MFLLSVMISTALAGAPKVAFEPPVVSRVEPGQQRIPHALRESVAVITVDQARLASFARQGGGLLPGFPLGPRESVALVLAPFDPFTEDAVVEFGAAAEGAVRRERLRSTGTILHGVVGDDPGSRVYIAATVAGTFGFVESRGRTFIVSSGPTGRGLPTVVYELSALPPGYVDAPVWSCNAVPAGDGTETPAEGGIAAAICRQLRVAFETDHEFYSLFGGDSAVASAYVATLTGALNEIYSRDLSLRVSTSYLRLWPEPADPWTATDAVQQLSQFRTNWLTQGFVLRDIAHMLSARPLGGGVAYIPGLCGSYGYGVSANMNGYFPSPLVDNSSQNWDIVVVAHEIGHGINMPHTHSMSPPVDGCGASPADCTVAMQGLGTLMSYCHLCSGGLANIRLQFHPASAAIAQSYLGAIGCNLAGTAVAPVAVADTAQGFNGVTTRIDVLANDTPFNCESVEISAFQSTSARGAAITRSIGTGAGGVDALDYALSSGATAGVDSFTYTLRDASGQITTAAVTVTDFVLRQPDNPTGALARLDASYYALAGETVLPDFAVRTPYLTDTVAQMNFPATSGVFAGSGRADQVGARFSGWITVPSSGMWTFTLASDEGSRLTIGSTVVVNHDGLHTISERSGSIALAAGSHQLTIDYFEQTGAAGLIAFWQGPGVAKAVIPATALGHGGSTSPADFNGDGAVNGADLTILLTNWLQSNSPYDLSGDGVVNGADITVVLFAWTG